MAMLLCAEEPLPLTMKKAIPLPGVEGRFDHAAFDSGTHRLFFAALGNDTLEVVEVSAATHLHLITGLKKPTGVLFLSEWNLLVVANGGDGTCRFYDGANYTEKGRVAGLNDADNLRFDAKTKRIYVGYAEGALGVIDPVGMKLISSIPLAKHPESFQVEKNGNRIFVNVPDARQIVVVDKMAGKVTAVWPLEDVRSNFPMALDEAGERLFIGCRHPSTLLVYDTESGKRVAETPMSGDVDDLFFEPTTSRLFASCGAGYIDVFQFTQPGSLIRSHQIASAAGARTAFYTTKPSAFYLAVPHRGSQEAEIRVFSLQP